MKNRNKFTMIELIFIIIIIGTLTLIIVPNIDVEKVTDNVIQGQSVEDQSVEDQSIEDQQKNTRENW